MFELVFGVGLGLVFGLGFAWLPGFLLGVVLAWLLIYLDSTVFWGVGIISNFCGFVAAE